MFSRSLLRQLPRSLPVSPSPSILSSNLRPFSSSLASTSALPLSSSPPEGGKLVLPSYFVPRTGSNQLPVYGDVKSGGARFLTVVRKVDGDLKALQKELSSHIPQADSFTKLASRQIVLRGDWVKEVKDFLGAKGF